MKAVSAGKLSPALTSAILSEVGAGAGAEGAGAEGGGVPALPLRLRRRSDLI